MESRAIVYIALAAFCLLSAMRDALSEVLFKSDSNTVDPTYALFVYSVVTQLVCLGLMGWRRLRGPALAAGGAHMPLGPTIMLNGLTLGAFLLAFLAIQSPLGAGLASLVDYGSTPVFAALVAWLFAGERLGLRFAIPFATALLGIIILSGHGYGGVQFSPEWMAGVAMALGSSAFLAAAIFYYKVLLEHGVRKEAILLFRLIATTACLGTWLWLDPTLVQPGEFPKIVLLGLFGFCAPLFLVLTILSRVQIKSFAMYLFGVPLATYTLAWAVGSLEPRFVDFLAAALVLVGVASSEWWLPRSESSEPIAGASS